MFIVREATTSNLHITSMQVMSFKVKRHQMFIVREAKTGNLDTNHNNIKAVFLTSHLCR